MCLSPDKKWPQLNINRVSAPRYIISRASRSASIYNNYNCNMTGSPQSQRASWVSMDMEAPVSPRSPEIKYALHQESIRTRKRGAFRRCFLFTLLVPAGLFLAWLSRRHPASPLSRFTTAAIPAPLGDIFLYATSAPDLAPYEAHPIKTLIAQGKKAWEEKVAKQSTNYDEVVLEYRRRYGRSPPNGFDSWCDLPVFYRPKLGLLDRGWSRQYV